MLFDWDDANILHLARHDITPDEAEQFHKNGPLDLDIQQDEHGEERFLQVGETNLGRFLVLLSTWRQERVRVITGWNARRHEKQIYFDTRVENEWLLD